MAKIITKKKPQDATLRNVRAGKKRDDNLTLAILALEARIAWVARRVDSIEACLSVLDPDFEPFDLGGA